MRPRNKFFFRKTGPLALLLSACAAAGANAASPPCGRDGAVYAPNPQPSLHDPDQPALDKLVIKSLPPSAPDAAFADSWVFQTFDPVTAKLLSTFAMEESCPNGSTLCRIGVPGSPDAVSSNVVELTQNFAPTIAAGQAPYAIILPDFASANWVFTSTSPETAKMQFFTSPPAYPNLAAALVWVRISCGAS